MLVRSYRHDLSPEQRFHPVYHAAAKLINQTAQRDLARLHHFLGLDEAKRKAHLEKLLAWCKDHAGMTVEELQLDALATADDWTSIVEAARKLADRKHPKALALMLRRVKDFPSARAALLEQSHRMDSADAVVAAREYIKDRNPRTRFWSSLILIRHGDHARNEGLDVLKEILKGNALHLHVEALDTLLASRDETVLALADAILKAQHSFNFDRFAALHRLFVAGRQKALDDLIRQLDSTGKAEGFTGRTVRDEAAKELEEWRTDGWKFDEKADEKDRQKAREALKTWLKEQFARIKAGKKPAMKTEPQRIWRWLELG
jgi:hypothetical protein